MPLVAGHELDIDCGSPQVYNAYDSMVTSEVLGELKVLVPGLNAPPELRGFQLIYDFERALQAPAIEMMRRGWRVDPWAREASIEQLRSRLTRLSHIIDAYAGAIWDQRSPTKRNNDYPAPKLLNPDSTTQLQKFFYEYLHITPIIRKDDGKEKFPMDRDALEKIHQYFLARPIVAAILAYRDTCGQLEVMESKVDPDWRMRTTFGVTTTTGRFSSSKSVTGTGRNMQNIEESLRYPFISDEGMKLVGADYEQAETRETGWLCWILFGDSSYLDDAESGDPHTILARIGEPDMDWNGDPKHDRKIADQIFYRHHSYREVYKRVRHGTEKGGQAQEIARQTRIPLAKVKYAQNKLFETYPCILKYFTWVTQQIQREKYLINAFGRRRDFFGRPDSNDTIKEGIAFMTQSPTADRMNLGLWRVWKYMGDSTCANHFELLAQLHDAIYGQRDESKTDEASVVKEIQRYLDIPMSHNGRRFTVPSEVKVGWCWSNATKAHPNGLMKYPEPYPRQRANTCVLAA